jgi:hypothetical protein
MERGEALKTKTTFLALGGLLALLLAAWACFNTNPYRAGEGTDGSLKAIPHNLVLGGKSHAAEICDPITYCSACHGANLQGGTNGEPSCTNCHTAYWTDPNCGQLLHTVSLGGHLHAPNYCQAWDNCAGCHGEDLRGGTNGEPSCYTCHNDLWDSADCGQNSHTVNLGGTYHAPNYCRPYQNCVSCHGEDLHGGTAGQPSCLKCHDQKKWMNCGSTQHNQSKDGQLHASGYCQPFDNCAFCHGNNLQGGPNHEPSCTECHSQLWTSSDCGGARGMLK